MPSEKLNLELTVDSGLGVALNKRRCRLRHHYAPPQSRAGPASGWLTVPGGNPAGGAVSWRTGASWMIFPPRYAVYVTVATAPSAPTRTPARIQPGISSVGRLSERHQE